MSEKCPTAGVMFARRMRQLRGRRFTHQELADELGRLGTPMSRVTLAKIEAGGKEGAKAGVRTRAANVSLEDVLAISLALGVAPINMLAAEDLTEPVTVTPNTVVTGETVREWVRGERPLPGQDARTFFSTAPEEEWLVANHPAVRTAHLMLQTLENVTGFGTGHQVDDSQRAALMDDLRIQLQRVNDEVGRILQPETVG